MADAIDLGCLFGSLCCQMTVERRLIAMSLVLNFCLTEYTLVVGKNWRCSSRRKAANDEANYDAASDVSVDDDKAGSGEEAMKGLVVCSRSK